MSDPTLQRILAFNQELAALSVTGLPMDLGFDAGESIPNRLERINTELMTQMGHGKGASEMISSDPALPQQYREAVETWLGCDDPTVALEAITSPAEAHEQFRDSIGLSLTYPLIVLSLAYLAFLYLCGFTVPRIEALYAQLFGEPGGPITFLRLGREWLPVWGIAVPAAIAVGLLCWRSRAARGSFAWMPGSKRFHATLRNANLADRMARLLENDCSLEESLQLVCPPVRGDDDRRDRLPALLLWAIEGDLGGESRARALRFVAETYRQMAERQQNLWRVAVPAVCGVVLGGTLVLAYGLSLFLPVIRLLQDISVPGGA